MNYNRLIHTHTTLLKWRILQGGNVNNEKYLIQFAILIRRRGYTLQHKVPLLLGRENPSLQMNTLIVWYIRKW